MLALFYSLPSYSPIPTTVNRYRAGFSDCGAWYGRGRDGETCLGTPTCDGACSLPGEGRAAPSPDSCLGWFGNPVARESSADPAAYIHDHPLIRLWVHTAR